MAPAQTSWPNSWNPWPDPVDESTARTWLSAPCDSNFTTFANLKPEKSEAWKPLEQALETITGCNRAIIRSRSRESCASVWGTKGLGTHANSSQLRSIGRKTSMLLLQNTSVVWKDHALQWTNSACIAIAPRHIWLWKKWKRKEASKINGPGDDINDDGDLYNDDDNTEASGSTTTALRRSSKASKQSKKSDNNKSIVKKQRITLHTKKNTSCAVDDESQELDHGKITAAMCHLVHCTIIVQMEKTLAKTLNVPFHVPVGIAAIVREEAQLANHEDIRCEHLSWYKFRAVLGAMCIEYKNSALSLYYAIPGGGESGTREMLIKDEIDFRRAVGTLDIFARSGGRGNKLFMSLRAEYHY